MNEMQAIGRRGEEVAARHLEAEGYKVVERNWRYRRYEIDIIAWKGDLLVIVEVKTRGEGYYQPERYVSIDQWRNIAFATSKYMINIDHEWEVRFDIISVTINGTAIRVRHYPDVFFPGR